MNHLLNKCLVHLMMGGVLLCLSGCIINGGVELTKTIWGSSTRALEQARVNAITKTYGQKYWDTIRATLNVIEKNDYEIFKKNEVNGYVVILGIKGSVNTTEVGIFFVEVNEAQTRVEISSLSTNAKRIVAKTLFQGLDTVFNYENI